MKHHQKGTPHEKTWAQGLYTLFGHFWTHPKAMVQRTDHLCPHREFHESFNVEQKCPASKIQTNRATPKQRLNESGQVV